MKNESSDTDEWFYSEFCDPEITPQEAMFGTTPNCDIEWEPYFTRRDVDHFLEPMDRRCAIGVPIAWRQFSVDVFRHNVRARAIGAIADLTPEQWEDIVNYYDGKCAYCEDTATVLEHIDPISKGGGTTATNVAPSCAACNVLKKNLDPDQWFKFLGITTERFMAKHLKAIS